MNWKLTVENDYIDISKAHHVYIEEIAGKVKPYLVMASIRDIDYVIEEFSLKKYAREFMDSIVEEMIY